MRRVLHGLCICQFLLLSALLAFGQGGRGTINGTVTDPSGAVVAAADVTVRDLNTGTVSTVTTSTDGHYSAPFLQTGTYEVSVVKQGFATETQSGVVLSTDQVTSVNFALKLGTESLHVDVNANATAVDTTTGAIGQVIDQKTITELPLNGRNPAALVALAPGAIDSSQVNGLSTPGPGSGFPNETAASVNGSRIGGVFYQLDGLVSMNNYFQTADPFPNPDATAEFRVITNNFDAQYGYTAGAIVSVATRGGTNEWHGGVFEFLRNNAFNAADYFTHQADPLKRNQFGGQIGGPIVKNKLFIFGNTQFTRMLLSASGGLQTGIPTAAEESGDFGVLCGSGFDPATGLCNDRTPGPGCVNGGAITANCQLVDQIYKSWNDHTPGNAFPFNKIDLTAFPESVMASKVFKMMPVAPPGDATGQVLLGNAILNDWTREFTIRTDYNLSNSQKLSGRIFWDNYNRPGYNGGGDFLLTGGNYRGWTAHDLNVAITHTWTINPNLVNNLVGGFHRNNSNSIPGLAPTTFQDLGSNLATTSQWFGSIGVGNWGPSEIPVIQGRHNWNFSDTVSWSKGKHTITAGGTVLTQYGLEQATWEGDPLVVFSGNVTGNANADFLLGLLDHLDASGGEYNIYSAPQLAAFGQDSIKLKPSLTLNLGLRWEPQIAPQSQDHLKTVDYIPGEQSTRFPNAPVGTVYAGDPGVPNGGWANKWDTFLPRVSFAWAPKALPKTSIRSAFAMMALPYDYSFYNHQSANAPFSPFFRPTYNQVGSCVLNIADPFACYAPTGFKDPFPPFAGPKFVPPSSAPITTPESLQAVFTKGFSPAMEESWNFSIQHALAADYVVTATYIGRHDYHIPEALEFNPGVFYCAHPTSCANYANNGSQALAPTYNSILGYKSIGVGSYNAGQISVEKRFTKGLEFTSNFTWSKNLDMSSQASISNVGSLYDPYNPRAAYGISDLNTPRIWNNTFVYQMPALHGLGAIGSAVLGGWEIGGLWQLHSGRPFSVGGGLNPSPDNNCGGDNASCANIYGDHADLIAGQSLNVHQGGKSHWLNQYFNTSAFTFNQMGTFGSTGRNILYGPGWNEADLAFSKNFYFRERYRLQVRWEMFNAFNRTEFGNPSSDYVTPGTPGSTFGKITYDIPLAGTTSSGRLCQAGVKLYF